MFDEKKLIPNSELFNVVLKTLQEGKRVSFTVTGMSMYPFLCHGRDRVIVGKTDQNHLQKGDIVLLKTNSGCYLLHRITKITENSIVTTGDSNCFRDGIFPLSCVVAKVIAVIRKGNEIDCDYWKWKLTSKLWMMLFPFRKKIIKAWFQIRKYLKRG